MNEHGNSMANVGGSKAAHTATLPEALATGTPAMRVPRVLKPLTARAERVGRTTGSAASIPAVVALAAVAAASDMVRPCVIKTLISTAKCRSHRCGGFA